MAEVTASWNCLVKVENGSTSGGNITWATVSQYQYIGLHWRIVIDADRSIPAGFDRRTYMSYSAGWQLLQVDIDRHTNNESPDGVNSRSREVWDVGYADDVMVRLMGKSEGGEHGTTKARVMAGGVSTERSMSRRAAQGTDVGEPTSVARSARVDRDFGASRPVHPRAPMSRRHRWHDQRESIGTSVPACLMVLDRPPTEVGGSEVRGLTADSPGSRGRSWAG